MNKKIVIACHLDGLKSRMDKNNFLFLEQIQKNSKHEVFLCETNKDNELIKKICSDVNTILIVFLCTFDNLHEIHNTKIYCCEDVCCVCKYKCQGSKYCKFNNQLQYSNNFDYVLYRYETYLTKTIFNDNKNKFKLPYFIQNYDIKINEQKKEYDILFY